MKIQQVQHCNFNTKGEFILFCTTKNENNVRVYSIQTDDKKTNCQKIYKLSEKAELLNISKYDKILLLLNNDIYEWNLLTGKTNIVFKNVNEVIMMFQILHAWLNL